MKRSRFSEEQIIAILKEQAAGMAAADVYRAAPINRAMQCGECMYSAGGHDSARARQLA